MAIQLTLLDGDTGGKRSSLELLAGEALVARTVIGGPIIASAVLTVPIIAAGAQAAVTAIVPALIGIDAELPLLITRNAVGLENVILLAGQVSNPATGEVELILYNADAAPTVQQNSAFTFLAPAPA